MRTFQRIVAGVGLFMFAMVYFHRCGNEATHKMLAHLRRGIERLELERATK